MEMTMTEITLYDTAGNSHKAAFRTIKDLVDAAIGVATLEADGETFSVPAVLYHDGTVICATDWQSHYMDDHEIVEEASDPAWAHHWQGPNGEPVVTIGGLPRLLG